jgi:hypothetical protein
MQITVEVRRSRQESAEVVYIGDDDPSRRSLGPARRFAFAHHKLERRMMMTDDDLKTYFDKYVSRLNPHGRKKLDDYLSPRRAEALRIDPKTARTCFNNGSRSDPPGLYEDVGDDPPTWLRAYLSEPGQFARAPGSELWVSFDLLPDATRERLEERVKPKRVPDDFDEAIARMAEHDRNMAPERKQRIEAFLAEAKAEAQKIDAETAEVTWDWREFFDPYCIYSRPSEFHFQVGREYFARNPGSDVWVHFADLPAEMRLKLRHKRKPSFTVEPLRLCRRPFCLSHAAMAVSFSMAK